MKNTLYSKISKLLVIIIKIYVCHVLPDTQSSYEIVVIKTANTASINPTTTGVDVDPSMERGLMMTVIKFSNV